MQLEEYNSVELPLLKSISDVKPKQEFGSFVVFGESDVYVKGFVPISIEDQEVEKRVFIWLSVDRKDLETVFNKYSSGRDQWFVNLEGKLVEDFSLIDLKSGDLFSIQVDLSTDSMTVRVDLPSEQTQVSWDSYRTWIMTLVRTFSE